MKRFNIVIFILCSAVAYGQSIIGQWETYDDKTNEKKAIIEIYTVGDLYFAKIVKSYSSPENSLCNSCKGDKRNKPIIGMDFIENLKKEGDVFKGGTIMDPENGETYNCFIKLLNKNKLKVRGYMGIALFGRTQYWRRKK